MIFWYEHPIFCHSPSFISYCWYRERKNYRVTRKEDFDIIWIEAIYSDKRNILLVFFEWICNKFFIEKKNIFPIEIFYASVCYWRINSLIQSFDENFWWTDKKIWRIYDDIDTGENKKESYISQIVFLIRCGISSNLDFILDKSRKWGKSITVFSKNIPFSSRCFWESISEEIFLIFLSLSRSTKFPISILFNEIADFRERDHIDYREIEWERGYLQLIFDFLLSEDGYMGFFSERNLSQFFYGYFLRMVRENGEDPFLHIVMTQKYLHTHSLHLPSHLWR